MSVLTSYLNFVGQQPIRWSQARRSMGFTNSLDFGELGPRDTSDPRLLTIANVGAWNVEVTSEVAGAAGDLYFDGLKLNGSLWDLFSEIINRGNDADCSATLTVPESYSGVGEQSGTVIFWAAEAP